MEQAVVQRIPANYQIDPGRSDDAAALCRIEVEAAALFPEEDLAPELRDDAHSENWFRKLAAEGRLWVVREVAAQAPVGFAALRVVDGSAHLEELDVLPTHGRRGLGRALVAQVVDWAREAGHPTLTLTTFRHLRWNAPFYESLGFMALEAEEHGPELRATLATEAAEGLDPAKRVAMRLDLGAA